MQEHVIIVAGGSGQRMQQELPKQFILIEGKPMVVYTIESFFSYNPDINVVLVLPESHFSTWKRIQDSYPQMGTVKLTVGGDTRFESVRSGLKAVPSGLVAIHDAVRPLVSREVIAASFVAAREKGSGVAMVALKDSIRQLNNGVTTALIRDEYLLVQTPQTFQVSLIGKAFDMAETTHFTDDASVFENAGYTVEPIAGDYRNIKVTTPEDLVVAKAFFDNFSK